jgi:hypothetical protein
MAQPMAETMLLIEPALSASRVISDVFWLIGCMTSCIAQCGILGTCEWRAIRLTKRSVESLDGRIWSRYRFKKVFGC